MSDPQRVEPDVPDLGAHIRVVKEGTWYWRCPGACGGHGFGPDIPDEPQVCPYEATPESGECGRTVPRSAYWQGPDDVYSGWVVTIETFAGHPFVRLADSPEAEWASAIVAWDRVRSVTVLSE